ncbi:MAG TPA: hypothetical protein VF375_08320 [Candidatus Limnocylindrales bacterium]
MSEPVNPASVKAGHQLHVRPSGFAGGFIGRNLAVAALSVVLLAAVGILFAGLEVVRVSPAWGFTYDGAVNGILGQLGVTGPAIVLISAATAANVFAGAIVLRLLGVPAFRRPSDLILAGFSAAVVLDSVVVFLLGSVGLCGWGELLVIHLAIAGAYVVTRKTRPLMAVPVRIKISRPAAWWLIVLAVWAGPIIVSLASPAVPFMDVLPNHVAPVEHIRVFGSFSTLTTSPSPIYGPSRLMLGYVALLGSLTTLTNLDAVLAEAAFAVPLTLLMALAARRLAGELFGGSASFWALLTFPLTFTFMRIPDSRGTVVVFPLAAWAFITIASELKARHGAEATPAAAPADAGTAAPADAGAAAPKPRHSRLPDIGLAAAIGGGFMVHPLIGLVAATGAFGTLVLYPRKLARRLVPALGGGLLIAVPQALTMANIETPSWVGVVFIGAGLVAAFALAALVGALGDRLAGVTEAAARRLSRARNDGLLSGVDVTGLFLALLVAAVIAIGLIIAAQQIKPSGDPTSPTDPAGEGMMYFPHLIWLTLLGALLSVRRFGRGWILLGCGIAAGLAAWTASAFVGNANLTQQAIHYEVPKSVEYWLPGMLAIGAAGGLAAVCRQRSIGFARPVFIAAILLVAIYPTTMPLTSNVQIGEHRAAESVGLAFREAELGYWNFNDYPDARLIIDAPRQAVVDMLRAEENAGRLGPSTRVLHIAFSFQQWSSVPIGVFTGALETSISLQPEVSIHTDGGRLLGLDQLNSQLASGYGYVVFEPDGMYPGIEGAVQAAGYRQIWANSQAIIYVRA